MSGNTELRRALAEASTLREPSEYRARIEQLRTRHRHAIRILDDGAGRLRRFNCFAYALGVWQGSRYERLVDRMQTSVLINSAFVADILERGELEEIQRHDVRSDDAALYFAGTELKHGGRIVSVSSDLTVHSKWGANEVHAHSLWEVSAEYGDTVRFFRPPKPVLILTRLEESYLGSD